MQQHVSNKTRPDISQIKSVLSQAHIFISQIWDQLYNLAAQTGGIITHQAKRVQPAAYVIALFLLMTFTFAVQSGFGNQALTTTALPLDAQTRSKPSTTTLAAVKPDSARSAPYIAGTDLKRKSPAVPRKVDSETLWLARAIYSETKRPEEQEIVAWVIRNRVETKYRGKTTYQEVVNDPYQFSAFNPGTATRAQYTSLTEKSQSPGFQKALAIAHQVINAPDSLRPFPKTTRHFYSPQSMVGGKTPSWVRSEKRVTPARDFTPESHRFRFYANVG